MELSDQIYGPAALPPGKEPRYPLNGRVGGLQRRSECFGDESNLLPLPGIEPWFLGRAAVVGNVSY